MLAADGRELPSLLLLVAMSVGAAGGLPDLPADRIEAAFGAVFAGDTIDDADRNGRAALARAWSTLGLLRAAAPD